MSRLAALALVLLIAAAPPRGREVRLSVQPGSALEATARALMAHDIRAARRAGETPLVLVGSARLATAAGPAALFAQVQSASLCGSAGCATSIYVRHGRTWVRVLDSVSGPIRVLATAHGGMRDLLVHAHDRWIWNGHSYADTLPVPPP